MVVYPTEVFKANLDALPVSTWRTSPSPTNVMSRLLHAVIVPCETDDRNELVTTFSSRDACVLSILVACE